MSIYANRGRAVRERGFRAWVAMVACGLAVGASALTVQVEEPKTPAAQERTSAFASPWVGVSLIGGAGVLYGLCRRRSE